jgi:phosphate transport system protein
MPSSTAFSRDPKKPTRKLRPLPAAAERILLPPAGAMGTLAGLSLRNSTNPAGDARLSSQEPRMSIHLTRDMEKLQKRIIALAGDVEDRVDKAIRALFNRDANLATKLMNDDTAIDMEENEIEEQCLKILALHQPVAIDLRRVASIFKINSELERMADLAVNIAERVHALARGKEVPIPHGFQTIADTTNTLVRDSIDSFVNIDVALAKRVCRMDEEVDRKNDELIQQAIQLMKAAPDNVEAGLNLFSICRQLERIADHATNIAEDVVYLVEGQIIRHHPEALND